MNKYVFALISASLLALTGCQSNKSSTAPSASAGAVDAHEAECLAPKPGIITSVNTNCVIVASHKVNPATPTARFNGQEIGFCCAGCIARWDALSDEGKTAALAKAMTPQ